MSQLIKKTTIWARCYLLSIGRGISIACMRKTYTSFCSRTSIVMAGISRFSLLSVNCAFEITKPLHLPIEITSLFPFFFFNSYEQQP